MNEAKSEPKSGKPRGRHPQNRLTALSIKRAKPGRHGDGNGLFLEVDANGSRRGLLRVVANDRRRDLGLSDDGLTAFVALRVDWRAYEFARHWALFHARADPEGTAENQLEGYLGMALMEAIAKAGWSAPPEIEALYPPEKPAGPNDMDDGIPF